MEIAMRFIAWEKAKVLQAIVSLDSIDVVDDLARTERASDFRLHDEPMLPDVALGIRLRMFRPEDINVAQRELSPAFPGWIFRPFIRPKMASPHSPLDGLREPSARKEMRNTSLAKDGQALIHGRRYFSLRLRGMFKAQALMGMTFKKASLGLSGLRPNFCRPNIGFHGMNYTMPNLYFQ